MNTIGKTFAEELRAAQARMAEQMNDGKESKAQKPVLPECTMPVRPKTLKGIMKGPEAPDPWKPKGGLRI